MELGSEPPSSAAGLLSPPPFLDLLPVTLSFPCCLCSACALPPFSHLPLGDCLGPSFFVSILVGLSGPFSLCSRQLCLGLCLSPSLSVHQILHPPQPTPGLFWTPKREEGTRELNSEPPTPTPFLGTQVPGSLLRGAAANPRLSRRTWLCGSQLGSLGQLSNRGPGPCPAAPDPGLRGAAQVTGGANGS